MARNDKKLCSFPVGMLQCAPKTRRGELHDVCSRSFLIFMVDVNFWNRTWHNPSVVGARISWGFSGAETFVSSSHDTRGTIVVYIYAQNIHH